MEMSEGLLRIADAAGFGDEPPPGTCRPGAFRPRPFPHSRSARRRRGGLLRRHVLPDAASGRSGRPHGVVGDPAHHRGAAPPEAVAFVAGQLDRVRRAVSDLVGQAVTDDMLSDLIVRANRIRRFCAGSVTSPTALRRLLSPPSKRRSSRCWPSTSAPTPRSVGAFWSMSRRPWSAAPPRARACWLPDACRVFWVNPVADLRVMNLLEELGGAVVPERSISSATPSTRSRRTGLRSDALARTALRRSHGRLRPKTGPPWIVRNAVRYKAEASHRLAHSRRYPQRHGGTGHRRPGDARTWTSRSARSRFRRWPTPRSPAGHALRGFFRDRRGRRRHA